MSGTSDSAGGQRGQAPALARDSGSALPTSKRIRVGVITPVPTSLNPYVSLMLNSVARFEGVQCELQEGFSPRWFFENWRALDVLHVHWVEYLFRASSTRAMWRKLAFYVAALIWGRSKGIKIVYTVHNMEPYGGRNGPYLVASRFTFACADAVHVHEESTRVTLAKRFRRHEDIHVIPHGNYVGAYPNTCSSSEARRTLRLEDDAFVYLFLGQIRPNKGVEDLIVAFSRIENPSIRLLVAGWATDSGYGRSIEGLARGDGRAMVRLGFVPDSELQCFFNASDVCVLPYRHFTTSGAILLALSFARPVIGPRAGSFVDLLKDGAGILYDPDDPAGLEKAMGSACETMDSHSRQLALERALDFDWSPIGAKYVALYRKLCGGVRYRGLLDR